jgi:hypothetical protein
MAITAAVSVIVVSGCQGDPTPAGGDKNTSKAAFIKCLRSAARKVDDGRSSPGEVALAAKSMCQSEYQRSLADFVRDLDSAVQQMIHRDMALRQHDLEIALQVVLEEQGAKAGDK